MAILTCATIVNSKCKQWTKHDVITRNNIYTRLGLMGPTSDLYQSKLQHPQIVQLLACIMHLARSQRGKSASSVSHHSWHVWRSWHDAMPFLIKTGLYITTLDSFCTCPVKAAISQHFYIQLHDECWVRQTQFMKSSELVSKGPCTIPCLTFLY